MVREFAHIKPLPVELLGLVVHRLYEGQLEGAGPVDLVAEILAGVPG